MSTNASVSGVGRQRLTAPQVVALLAELENCIVPEDTPDAAARICRAQQIFETLEREWRVNPVTLQPFVARLKQGRARLAERRRLAANQIADAFCDVKRRVAELEERAAGLRDALIELFRESGETDLRACGGVVRVQPRRTREFPRPGTPERHQLEDVLRRQGVWEAVSTVSAPMLFKLLSANSNVSALEEVRALCPEREAFAVVVRDAGPA